MSPIALRPSRRARANARPRVEDLESRNLLSGNFPGPVTFAPGGFTHTIELNLLVQDTNNDGIVNLGEKNSAPGGMYEFRGTLVGPSAPFHASISIAIITAAGASLGQTTTINVPPGSATGTFAIQVATGGLVEGANNLRLRVDRASSPGVPIDLYPFDVPVDTQSVGATITPVTPDPRVVPVSGPIVVTFSGSINAGSFTTSALSLKRNNGANLLVGASGITIQAKNGSSTTFNIGGLSALTTPVGTYEFSVDSTKVNDLAGNPGAGTTSDTFQVVAVVPPSVKTLGPIANSARNFPLSEPIAVEFEQAIDASTFTPADLALTLHGGANLITPASGVTIAQISTTRFQIEGLAGLTAAAGRYLLSVDTRAVQNEFGTVGTSTKTAEFLIDLLAPVLTNIPADRTVNVLPTASGAVVVFPGSSATDDFSPSPTITYTPASGSFLPVGLNTITVKATDGAGNATTATFRVTVVAVAPPDLTAPTVTSLVPTAGRKGSKEFTAVFSEPMDAATVGRVQAYDIRKAGRDRRFGTKDDVRSRIIAAVYDPGSRTVKLTVAKAVAVKTSVRVTILGTTEFAAADAAGNRLKGGADHVVTLRVPAPPKKPKR